MSLLLFLVLFPFTLAANPARKIVVHKDEVVTVKTALGIATILQVPDQPTSVVLGDTGAFKIEYLNQAITIKPLHARATSNLYIHTDYDRYSIKLVSGAQNLADYLVYLKSFTPKKEILDDGLQWKLVGTRWKFRFGEAQLVRMAKTPTTILLEFEIFPISDGFIDPGSFWLIQEKVNKPIQDLLLSSLEAKRDLPITARLVIKKSDLRANVPATVDIRMKDTVSFYLSKELLWKN